jgi:hypothetical protein
LTPLLRGCFLPAGLAGGVARTLLVAPLVSLGGLLRAAPFSRLRTLAALPVRLSRPLHRLIGTVWLAAALCIRLLRRFTRLRPGLIAQRIGRLLRIALRLSHLAVRGRITGLGTRGIGPRLLLPVGGGRRFTRPLSGRRSRIRGGRRFSAGGFTGSRLSGIGAGGLRRRSRISAATSRGLLIHGLRRIARRLTGSVRRSLAGTGGLLSGGLL